MIVAWTVAVLVGVSVVLQGGFNRQVGEQWGLVRTVVVNGLVFLVVSVLLWLWMKLRPGLLPREFLPPEHGGPVAVWRFVLPGVFGVLIVTGLPWAIGRMGALGAILVLLVTQLVVSILWDFWVEGVPASPLRIAGASLALVGAWLANSNR